VIKLPISLEGLVEYLLKEKSSSLNFLEMMLTVNRFQLLSALKKLDGIEVMEDSVKVDNRVKLVISALKIGINPKTISKYLDWKEFEDEVARIFEEAGFIIAKNFRTNEPKRTETDIIALKEGIVLAIDCKHWDLSKSIASSYKNAALKHVERVAKLIESEKFMKWLVKWETKRDILVVPVLITLSSRPGGFINGVISVPISYISNFAQNMDAWIDQAGQFNVEIKRVTINEGCTKIDAC